MVCSLIVEARYPFSGFLWLQIDNYETISSQFCFYEYVLERFSFLVYAVIVCAFSFSLLSASCAAALDEEYVSTWFMATSYIKGVFLGLVHTMPDKFENATLLLRLGLPSTLQRTYPHKKIRENGTF